MDISSLNSGDGDEGARLDRLKLLLRITIILGVAGLVSSLAVNLATGGALNWITGAVAFPFGIAVAAIAHKIRSIKDDESDQGSGRA